MKKKDQQKKDRYRKKEWRRSALSFAERISGMPHTNECNKMDVRAGDKSGSKRTNLCDRGGKGSRPTPVSR
jgi:hypothetical protein